MTGYTVGGAGLHDTGKGWGSGVEITQEFNRLISSKPTNNQEPPIQKKSDIKYSSSLAEPAILPSDDASSVVYTRKQ